MFGTSKSSSRLTANYPSWAATPFCPVTGRMVSLCWYDFIFSFHCSQNCISSKFLHSLSSLSHFCRTAVKAVVTLHINFISLPISSSRALECNFSSWKFLFTFFSFVYLGPSHRGKFCFVFKKSLVVDFKIMYICSGSRGYCTPKETHYLTWAAQHSGNRRKESELISPWKKFPLTTLWWFYSLFCLVLFFETLFPFPDK